MIAPLQSGGVSRRFNPAAQAGVALAVVFVIARACEEPASPATAFRIVVAFVAIGVAVFARKRSLVERAAIFFGLEAIAGIVAFAYIDVPFIMSHQTQIGHLAVAVAREVARTH